jgi:hypothetical protein
MADLSIADDFAMALDPVLFMRRCGIDPDLKQQELLTTTARRTLVCCTRQWGKSTTAAGLACHEVIYNSGALVILVSPSQQQSIELLKKVHSFWKLLPHAPAANQESLTRLSLENGSRVVSLPGSERTIRGYSAASLVIMDEAARVDDALLAAVRPMQATVEDCRFIALSTPAGKRGWFYEAWINGAGWHRISVRADECERISAAFLAEELQSLGPMRYSEEYFVSFRDDSESVFPLGIIAAAFTDQVRPLWT